MVSVRSLDATFKMKKGAMLPPALTRERPNEGGQAALSGWTWRWDGVRAGVRTVGPRDALSLGIRNISGTSAWHLHRAERKEGGSGGEQALLRSTFETKRFY